MYTKQGNCVLIRVSVALVVAVCPIGTSQPLLAFCGFLLLFAEASYQKLKLNASLCCNFCLGSIFLS